MFISILARQFSQPSLLDVGPYENTNWKDFKSTSLLVEAYSTINQWLDIPSKEQEVNSLGRINISTE